MAWSRGSSSRSWGKNCGEQVGLRSPRYDTLSEFEVLRELDVHLGLYVNFFQPQTKLVEKTREGAMVCKRFDTARTPYQRVLASPHVFTEVKEALTGTYRGLSPSELKCKITRCQDGLIAFAKHKPEARKEVG
jgi:hypothetical protein